MWSLWMLAFGSGIHFPLFLSCVSVFRFTCATELILFIFCGFNRDREEQQVEQESGMSQQDAQAFVERMKYDDAFHEAVIRLEEMESRIAFINREGFDCTLDEISLLPKEYKNGAEGSGRILSAGH